MACSGCRKTPAPIRRPSSVGSKRAVPNTPQTNNTTGGQRTRITGLNYVPNKK